jgi:predicted transcriptional regulator
LIGTEPKQGCREAFQFALQRPNARAAEFAVSKKDMSIANASMKFKQLWEHGFLLRQESAADSGGVEYVYQRIG